MAYIVKITKLEKTIEIDCEKSKKLALTLRNAINKAGGVATAYLISDKKELG